MKSLLIATTNRGKFSEISEALKSIKGFEYELIFLREALEDLGDFVEDGESFAENAFKKAKFYGDMLGMPSLGEDSGIVVNALKGELGLKTRRWGAGESATDEEWLSHFMTIMNSKPERSAKFVCNACLYFPDKEFLPEPAFFEGETHGTITKEIMAPIINGLPLSSVFLPNGFDKVYAALSPTEKNQISHRGKAILALGNFLANH